MTIDRMRLELPTKALQLGRRRRFILLHSPASLDDDRRHLKLARTFDAAGEDRVHSSSQSSLQVNCGFVVHDYVKLVRSDSFKNGMGDLVGGKALMIAPVVSSL